MENNDNNNILVGAILGSLAVVGIAASIYILNKKGIFDNFSQEYLNWAKLKKYDELD